MPSKVEHRCPFCKESFERVSELINHVDENHEGEYL